MSRSAHLRGHVFLFETPSVAAWSSATGVKLLLIFLFLEVVVGPRMWILPATPPSWVRVPLMLAAVLILIKFVARVNLSQIGLYRWRLWSTIERSYFIQVLVLANGIFLALFADRIGVVLRRMSWRSAIAIAVTYLIWGFYQEVIYRGILQSELVRRFGAIAGVLASNIFYTFGPLHITTTTSPAMFAAIFAIGLFFAILFHRSGNLWMVAIFHGIGDVYITGLAT